MRVFAIAGALTLGVCAQSANATVSFSLADVAVAGTQRTEVVDYTCQSEPCSSTTSPYHGNIFAILGQPNTSVPGITTFTGRAGARNTLSVTLQYDGSGNLISTSLQGFDEVQRCTSLPCTSILASYTASNFAIQAFDSETGLTTVLAPVPEPATWALMLLGFMSAGLALRRSSPLKAAVSYS